MPSIEVLGAYPVEKKADEACYLVEILVTDAPEFDLANITQEDPKQSQEYWQAPYLERMLAAAHGAS
jgi:hypothetical protein